MSRSLAGFCLATVCLFGCKSSFDGLETDTATSAEAGESSEVGESTGGDEGTRFLAVGNDYILHTSVDGSAWTDRTPSLPLATGRLSGAAYGNGVWVAVGGVGDSYNQVVMRSDDGESFELVPADLDAREGVIFGGEHFVAFGFDSARSSDGLSWQVGGSLPGLMTGMAYGEGTYVAVGATGVPGSAIYASSSDGLSWTAGQDTESGFLKVAYGEGNFIAVGFDGRIAASSDGLNWSEVANTGELTTGVAYDGEGFFAAVGGAHVMWTSGDGGTWTNTGVAAYDHLAYSAATGVYVGVSGDGSRGYTDELSGFIPVGDSAGGYWAVAAR